MPQRARAHMPQRACMEGATQLGLRTTAAMTPDTCRAAPFANQVVTEAGWNCVERQHQLLLGEPHPAFLGTPV